MYYKFTITIPLEGDKKTTSSILVLADSEEQAKRTLGNNYPPGTVITCNALERSGRTGSLSASSHLRYPQMRTEG